MPSSLHHGSRDRGLDRRTDRADRTIGSTRRGARRVRTVVRASLVGGFWLLVFMAGTDSAAMAQATAWQPPVDGRVVRGFDPPALRWGAGHRGVDFAASPDEVVRAAGAGTVTFAGAVAGSLHVTVAHANGLRTSYSYLRSTVVRAGAEVERGQAIGRAGAAGDGHGAGTVHLGLRVGDTYLDPMILFESVDLTEVVRLIPPEATAGEGVTDDHDELVDLNYAIERSESMPEWLFAADWMADERDRRRGSFERFRSSALGVIGSLGGLAWSSLDDVAHSPVLGSTPLAMLMDGAEAMVDELSDECTRAGALPGRVVAHRDVMFVAGLDSSTDEAGATNTMPLDEIYPAERVDYFSYRGRGLPYESSDTRNSIDDSARRLRDQLRAARREAGDRLMETDLVAHSQGGVVVQRFLDRYWDPDDPTLPRISRVVMISSPLEGAPGAVFLDEAGILGGGASLRDLRVDSEIAAAAREWRPPEDIEVVSIGVTLDPIVPATSNDDIAGVASVPTRVGGWPGSVHSDATGDTTVLERAALFLGSGDVPCSSMSERLEAAAVGNAVTGLENKAGLIARGLGALSW